MNEFLELLLENHAFICDNLIINRLCLRKSPEGPFSADAEELITDDLNWFFTTVDVHESGSETVAIESVTDESWNEIVCDYDNIACGLQHFQPWETSSAFQLDKIQSAEDKNIALPMNFAMHVADYLWSEPNHSLAERILDKKSKGREFFLRSDPSYEKRGQHHECNMLFHHNLNVDGLVVTSLPGSPPSLCGVYTNAFTFTSSRRAWARGWDAIAMFHSMRHESLRERQHRNRQESSQMGSNLQDQPSNNPVNLMNYRAEYPRISSTSDMEFSIVVLVTGTMTLGNDSDGEGASRQSASWQVTSVTDAPSPVSDQDCYISRVVASLVEHEVQLVLAGDGMSSEQGARVEDACASSGIAIFRLPASTILALSALLGCGTIEDPLDLEEEDVCFSGVSVRVVSSLYASAVNEEEAATRVTRQAAQIPSDHSNSDRVLLLLQPLGLEARRGAVGCGSPTSFTPSARRAVSVVLAGYANAGVADLRTKFFQCLHRLRNAAAQGVMVGAGVPELLTSVCLEEECELLSKRLSGETQSYRGRHGRLTDRDWDLEAVAVLGAMAEGLDDYVVNLCVTFGSRIAEAMERVRRVKEYVRQRILGGTGARSVLDWISSLTDEERLSLPAPISRGDEDGEVLADAPVTRPIAVVLDAVDVKKQAMRTAVASIRQVLCCGMIISEVVA